MTGHPLAAGTGRPRLAAAWPRAEARCVLALVRRDLAQRRTARLTVVLDLLFGALNLVVFAFIGRVLRHPAAGPVAAAGGYFGYAAVGIAFFLVIQTATTGITRQVRDEQHSGTLELLVAQPGGPGSLALGLAGFPFLFATIRAFGYLLIAAALGLRTSAADWPGVIAVLAASAPAMAAIGIALAALALLLDRGDVLGRFAAFGLGFLSGAYFPLSELGSPWRGAGALLPTSIALDGQRAALAGAPWAGDAGALAAFGAAALPLSVLGFAAALRWARSRGRLTCG